MTESGQVHVRLFGDLRAFQRERGGAVEMDAQVPPAGIPARELACELDLPVERIEGVFCNRVVHGLSHVIMPGDRVAFVPYGTPGPHRFFLGLYKAGHEDSENSTPR
jgi:hypothetical protein